MTFLIDTQIFIWWTSMGRRLKPDIVNVISNAAEIFVSPASVWEIATKRRLKKLDFKHHIVEAIEASGFAHLPITPEDAEYAGGIIWDHKDPFDRLLVAQAARRSYTLVTADKAIHAFGTIPILWAG